MSEEELPREYAEVESRIERSVSPYITVRIPMPEGVDREEFLKLENDPRFINALSRYTRRWLTRKARKSKSSF